MRPGAAFPLLALLLFSALAPPAQAWTIVHHYDGPGEEYHDWLFFWVYVTTGDVCVGVDLTLRTDPCDNAPTYGPALGAGFGVDLGFIAVCVEEMQVETNEDCDHAMDVRGALAGVRGALTEMATTVHVPLP